MAIISVEAIVEESRWSLSEKPAIIGLRVDFQETECSVMSNTMLDPSVLDVARRQVSLFLKDRLCSTREEVGRVECQHAAQGILNSSVAQGAIVRILRAELIERALLTWDIYKRLLPADQPASTDLSKQLKAEVTSAVDGSLDDVKQFYSKTSGLVQLPNGLPQFEELYIEARDKMETAIDEYFLTRAPQPARQSVAAPLTPEPHPTLIDAERLQQLKALTAAKLDVTRLVALCEELNKCYAQSCFMAVAALTRALLDHVPPVFGCASFKEVANNYKGAKSFRESMQHLDNSARKVGDAHLHVQMRSKEILPTQTQVNFSNNLDVLLGEVVRVLS
jgi:hypothetical protein